MCHEIDLSDYIELEAGFFRVKDINGIIRNPTAGNRMILANENVVNINDLDYEKIKREFVKRGLLK